MTDPGDVEPAAQPPDTREMRPNLVGSAGVSLRPGRMSDVAALCGILRDPEVVRWWGDPEEPSEVEAKLLGDSYAVLLVVEVDRQVAGGIEYWEENEPAYRHAGIDIYLSSNWQGRGVGTQAVSLLADFLFDVRDHRRLTIDPAVTNLRAIRSYEKVGFRRVGVMREYERAPDGTYHDGLLMDLLRSERRRTS